MTTHPVRRYTRDYRAHLAATIYDTLTAVLAYDAAEDAWDFIRSTNEEQGFSFEFNAPMDGVLRVDGVHFSPAYLLAVFDEVARAYPAWSEGTR